MPWCLEPRAEGRRRASPLGSGAAAAAGCFCAGTNLFHFLHFILYRERRAGLDAWGRERRGASAAGEADILNSWERRRIGFHDRVVQSWGDLQVVWQRPRSFSVMDAHRKKRHRTRSPGIHVDALEKRQIGHFQQTDTINVVDLQNIQCVFDVFKLNNWTWHSIPAKQQLKEGSAHV